MGGWRRRCAVSHPHLLNHRAGHDALVRRVSEDGAEDGGDAERDAEHEGGGDEVLQGRRGKGRRVRRRWLRAHGGLHVLHWPLLWRPGGTGKRQSVEPHLEGGGARGRGIRGRLASHAQTAANPACACEAPGSRSASMPCTAAPQTPSLTPQSAKALTRVRGSRSGVICHGGSERGRHGAA